VGDADTGELQFMEKVSSGTNYVGFKAPDSITNNIVWKLPEQDGSANQILTTDGAANLSWEDASGSGPTGPTGPNPSAGLNAALPYEPWNRDILDSSANFGLPQHQVIFIQFIAPSSAQYTQATICTGATTPAGLFSGEIGIAIYDNALSTNVAGYPNNLICEGEDTTFFNYNTTLDYRDFTLSGSPLIAGNKYWIGISRDNTTGIGNLLLSAYNDYDVDQYAVLKSIGGLYNGGVGFTSPAGTTIGDFTIAGADVKAYWFRIYDPSSSFLVGPQGPTGAAGASPFDASGNLDLSCNDIVDVSGIYFCDGTFIGEGSSFDISTNQVFKIKVTDSSNAFVIDQSGNVGIDTANPQYRLDVHRRNFGDIFKLRNDLLASDTEILIGTSPGAVAYINSAVTSTWAGGTRLRLQSGGTNVATIEPTSGVTYPSALDLTSEKLTLGGVEGLAGQVITAKGDGFGGVAWSDQTGDASGNAAIPYEPWNLNVGLQDTATVALTVYYVQFIVPSTALYTQMTIYIAPNTTNPYSGDILVGIYSDRSTVPPGQPATLLAQGSTSIISSNIQKNYLTFDLSDNGLGADLSANVLYWAAIGHDPVAAQQLHIVEHIDYLTAADVV